MLLFIGYIKYFTDILIWLFIKAWWVLVSFDGMLLYSGLAPRNWCNSWFIHIFHNSYCLFSLHPFCVSRFSMCGGTLPGTFRRLANVDVTLSKRLPPCWVWYYAWFVIWWIIQQYNACYTYGPVINLHRSCCDHQEALSNTGLHVKDHLKRNYYTYIGDNE